MRRRAWNDEPVVIVEGELDTLEGCDSVRRRIGQRINEIECRVRHVQAKAATPERAAFVDGLREERAALETTRAAVMNRKTLISNALNEYPEAAFRSAVRERFGDEIMRELQGRANDIHEAALRRRKSALVGSAIPVGAIRGARMRKEEKGPLVKNGTSSGRGSEDEAGREWRS